MKTILATILLTITFSIPAEAAGLTEENCRGLHDLSEVIMTARQNGVPITKILEIIDRKVEFEDVTQEYVKIIQKLHTGIALEAYDSPLFHTQKNKDIAIREFANAQLLGCYSAISSD